MRFVRYFSAGLVAMAFVGQAQSAQLTGTTQLSVDVASGCTLTVQPTVAMSFPVSNAWSTAGMPLEVNIQCNKDMPYELVTSAGATGKIAITDSVSGQSYDAGLEYLQAYVKAPITRTATGWPEGLVFFVKFNEDVQYGIPKVGTYTGSVVFNLNY